MNRKFIASPNDCILVTGSNGFIGSKVVQELFESGFVNLRCFVRPSSKLDRLKKLLGEVHARQNVEFVIGDLLSQDDCRKATAGVSIIYHLAAGMEKSFAGAFMNSALGTRNLMDAFIERSEPKRFVNVSSFAVYSNLSLKRGALLDETCPLEDVPQERFDAYGFGKLKQEQLVRNYGDKHNLPYVILRPGYVFGPGKRELNGRVAISTFGFLIQVGGSHLLPLTFVDNCAEAIVLAGLTAGIDGEVFNVVDDELLSGRQFLKLYKAKLERSSVRIPYVAAYGLCFLWEKYAKWSNGQLPAVFNRRRCAAEWNGNRSWLNSLASALGFPDVSPIWRRCCNQRLLMSFTLPLPRKVTTRLLSNVSSLAGMFMLKNRSAQWLARRNR